MWERCEEMSASFGEGMCAGRYAWETRVGYVWEVYEGTCGLIKREVGVR